LSRSATRSITLSSNFRPDRPPLFAQAGSADIDEAKFIRRVGERK